MDAAARPLAVTDVISSTSVTAARNSQRSARRAGANVPWRP
jgi:hypothetical protein